MHKNETIKQKTKILHKIWNVYAGRKPTICLRIKYQTTGMGYGNTLWYKGGPTYGHFQRDLAVKEIVRIIIDEIGKNFKGKSE